MNNTPEYPNVTAIRKVAAMTSRKLKTPANLRANARNWQRRQKGIPEDAPIGTRKEPFNKKKRGTGNVKRMISMPPASWDLLDNLADYHSQTRGEVVADALRTESILSQM